MRKAMQVDPLRLLFAGLSCYRLSRLLAWEEGPFGIFSALQRALGGKDIDEDTGQPKTLLGRFVGCPYCLGVWIALGLYFLLVYPTIMGDAFLIIMGLSGFQAYLQGTSD